MIRFLIPIVCLSSLSCATPATSPSSLEVLPASRIQWQKLNPARGNKSPKAGTLWGDRKAAIETGFLVKFVDGFSSPPHIHNVSYRGIVLTGLVHNDDPKAAHLWMPPLSYWTQPAGESHITSAKGKENIAFIEIDQGPYLVRPTHQAFDNGERPFNIHHSNIMWTQDRSAKTALLWRSNGGRSQGRMVRFSGKHSIEGAHTRVVVIQGAVNLSGHGAPLTRGSMIHLKGARADLRCKSEEECTLYVKSRL